MKFSTIMLLVLAVILIGCPGTPSKSSESGGEREKGKYLNICDNIERGLKGWTYEGTSCIDPDGDYSQAIGSYEIKDLTMGYRFVRFVIKNTGSYGTVKMVVLPRGQQPDFDNNPNVITRRMNPEGQTRVIFFLTGEEGNEYKTRDRSGKEITYIIYAPGTNVIPNPQPEGFTLLEPDSEYTLWINTRTGSQKKEFRTTAQEGAHRFYYDKSLEDFYDHIYYAGATLHEDFRHNHGRYFYHENFVVPLGFHVRTRDEDGGYHAVSFVYYYKDGSVLVRLNFKPDPDEVAVGFLDEGLRNARESESYLILVQLERGGGDTAPYSEAFLVSTKQGPNTKDPGELSHPPRSLHSRNLAMGGRKTVVYYHPQGRDTDEKEYPPETRSLAISWGEQFPTPQADIQQYNLEDEEHQKRVTTYIPEFHSRYED